MSYIKKEKKITKKEKNNNNKNETVISIDKTNPLDNDNTNYNDLIKNKIVMIRTEHSSSIKTLFEILKDILCEINIEIIKHDEEIFGENSSIEKGGIKIAAANDMKSIMIYIRLYSDKFNTFWCSYDKFNIGVNLSLLGKAVKSIDKNNILNIFVNENNSSSFFINIQDYDKIFLTEFEIKMMDVDINNCCVPVFESQAIVNINSSDFQEICKSIISTSEKIEIKCHKDKIEFSSRNEFMSVQKTIYTNDISNSKKKITITFNNECKDIKEIHGVFESKYLSTISKCCGLCNEMRLYLKNDFPLCIEYSIATLGNMIFCIAPCHDDD